MGSSNQVFVACPIEGMKYIAASAADGCYCFCVSLIASLSEPIISWRAVMLRSGEVTA